MSNFEIYNGYVKPEFSLGGFYKIIVVVDTAKAANSIMERNKDLAVITEHQGKIYISKKTDFGTNDIKRFAKTNHCDSCHNKFVEDGYCYGCFVAKYNQNIFTMNWAAWENKYKPVTNHIDDNASYDGFMFKTYGKELDFIKDQEPLVIWTILENDNGVLIVSNGYYLGNRMGYIITKNPFNENEFIEIFDEE
ncbi:MAG: hypothetical protein HRU28_17260 [Rhizobiales bacterium]|nr:hypothetical protein [Hyphomicrobiales bacterium]